MGNCFIPVDARLIYHSCNIKHAVVRVVWSHYVHVSKNVIDYENTSKRNTFYRFSLLIVYSLNMHNYWNVYCTTRQFSKEWYRKYDSVNALLIGNSTQGNPLCQVHSRIECCYDILLCPYINCLVFCQTITPTMTNSQWNIGKDFGSVS